MPTSMVIIGQVGGGLGAAPTRRRVPTTLSRRAAPLGLSPPRHPAPHARADKLVLARRLPRRRACNRSARKWRREQPRLTVVIAPAGHLPARVGHASFYSGPMGLIGMLVVTAAPSGTTPGTAIASGTVRRCSTTRKFRWNSVKSTRCRISRSMRPCVPRALARRGCGPASRAKAASAQFARRASYYHSCYPPAVNYTPFYYLINGWRSARPVRRIRCFQLRRASLPLPWVLPRLNRNRRQRSGAPGECRTADARAIDRRIADTGFSGAGAAATVNGFTLIAEDGNVVPGTPAAPRVQTDIFMAAGKTFDVMVNTPATPAGATVPPSLPIYDRELSLSANPVRARCRNDGLHRSQRLRPAGCGRDWYIFSRRKANPDTYDSLATCTTATSRARGYIGCIQGRDRQRRQCLRSPLLAPTNGTLTCSAIPGNAVPGLCANGTFTIYPRMLRPHEPS